MDIDARRRELIQLIESLPEVAVEVGGDADQHLGFVVRKRRFAWYLNDHHGDGIVALTCKAPPGLNTQRAALEPDRFFIPSYTGSRGWLGVRLDLQEIDWDEIAELVEDAYEMTAPKSLVARLENAPPETRSDSRPGDVVRSFFEAMQARDWVAAGKLLSPSALIEFTETGERFDGSAFLAMNEAYPEGWSIDVLETISAGDRVAAHVRVDHGDDVFRCAGFYTVINGVIVDGVENWVTEESQPPPEWRQAFVKRR